jgi:rhomboid protease GluP
MGESIMSDPTPDVAADSVQPDSLTFGAARAQRHSPVITISLIAINVIVFIAGVVLSPGWLLNPTTSQLLTWGANFAPLTLHGQAWRLITSCFLHIGVIHIAMNMFILFQIGVFAEMLFGRTRLLLLYLLAGLWGSIASVAGHPPVVAAGASGAVFGVYGAVLAFLLVQRGVIPSVQAWSIAKSAGVFIAYNLLYGLARPGIDIRAHIGGLIGGFVVGAALARPLSPDGQHSYAIRSATVTVLSVGVAWLCLSGMSAKVAPRDELVKQILAGKSVPAGKNDKVIYSGTATETDARNLGKALVTVGYFAGRGGVALLSKDADGTTISFITSDKDPAKPGDGSAPKPDLGPHLVPLAWNDPDFLARVQTTATFIAPSVGGPPVNIALLTSDGVPEKVLKVDTRILKVGTQDSIWYSGAATSDEAKALGKALQTIGFFRDHGGRVLFSKNGGASDVSFVVRDGAWDDPKIVAGFQSLGRKLSQAMGAEPLHIHLIDTKLQSKKDL